MRKKVALGVGAAVLLGIGGSALMLGNKSPRYDFRFDRVTRGDVDMHVITTGTLNAVVSVDVGTQVSGVIADLYADFNSEVKKGEVIARIDTTLLAQAVEDARAAFAAAQAKADNSEKVYQREKLLVKQQLDSQANLDSAMTAATADQQALIGARSALDQARINLGYATIRAPVDGTVVNRAVTIGETVAASIASPVLYTIANDLSRMQVLATVDESDIGMISNGQKATFTVGAYPGRTFEGTVSQIRLAPVTIQNVTNYTVVIDVNNADLKLMPGMTADVAVDVGDARNVLRVPNLALRLRPPADLVDSSALRAARAAIAGSPAPGVEDAAQSATAPDGAVHAAALSGRGRSRLTSPLAGHIVPPPKQEAEYGITDLYPEFVRPEFQPSHEAGIGRVWVLEGRRRLRPVFVRTGVSDGKYTEVTSDSLAPGEQIVLGARTAADMASRSGFLPGGGQRFGRRF